MSAVDREVSVKLQIICRAVEEIVTEVTGEKMGITLIVTPFERAGDLQYVSNCHRVDMHKALTDLLNGWNAGMQDVPTHEKN
jgi:hypothetical protein